MKRMIDFCAERVLSVGDTYFEHNNLHKYTRVAGGNEDDRSRYAALCTSCENSMSNGARSFRS